MIRLLVLALVALLIAGCGPRNLQECIAEATNRPTQAGVLIAANQCREKFSSVASAQGARILSDEEVGLTSAAIGDWDDAKAILMIAAFGLIIFFYLTAGARIVGVRIVRAVAGTVFVFQIFTVLPAIGWLREPGAITGAMAANLVVKILVLLISGALFLWLRGLINNMHQKQHGVPHPTLSTKRWTL